ncbi:MAG: NifU family protein [Alphaproteobacteria bacterium]|nr:NifU family protein [Alphaproteobacteria bacterium]
MFIQTENTPNPNTLKFLPGRPVMARGVAEFKTVEEAGVSMLAQKLMGLEGVTAVFFGTDFISVTKLDMAEWEAIKTRIMAAIMDHYMTGLPLFREGMDPQEKTAVAAEDDELTTQIKELLETRVRPMVAQDGGDIVFDRFEDGIVYLTMRGACAGCPSSTMTLKSGIENMLRHYVPEVLEVRQAGG